MGFQSTNNSSTSPDAWKPNSARRKRLLINPRFQAVFALYAIVTTILTIPIFVAINFYFFNMFVIKARSMELPAEHELLQFVDRQYALMAVVLVAATVIAVLLSVIFSYIFSNRIAGSMYRLTTAMNQTNDAKNAQNIHPREFDFFKEMFEAYNQLMDRLRS